MKFENDHLGYAFEGDYPESYGDDEIARLRTVVERQLGGLAGNDPDGDARLLGILMGRRASGDLSRAQVEWRRRRRGSLSLLARGEVLVPADASLGEMFRGYTGSVHHKAGRTGRICLRRSCAAAGEIDRVIDRAAAEKLSASPNYLSTMAAVGKGVGGPEPAPPLPAEVVAELRGGSGTIRVAVIDTGIPQDGRPDGVLNDVKRRADRENIDELDVFPAGKDDLLDYQAGHGTFVAGVVRRVAPHADIVVYRAADSDGFATDHDIAEAILQAYADGAHVINLSLGIQTVDDQPPPAIAAAVAHVAEDSRGGTVLVAAAGNNGDDDAVFPASLEGVEAVAGLTPYLTPSRWSSYGDKVRFSTVAEGIRSTFVSGTESPVFDPSPDTFGEDAWALWSGTSFAAPQIAGAIARICDQERIEPRAAVDRLDEFGKPIPGYGKAMRILQGLG
jgi:thermitase